MYDVNGDGYASPIDALMIIRELNRAKNKNRFDVNGDGPTSPVDALTVI